MSLKTPILIFCRIKPSVLEEQEVQDYSIKHGFDKDVISINSQQIASIVNHRPDSYSFQFVKVFDQSTCQEIVYNTVAKPVVQSALKGYNGTIFAYGQTGSGKTFTISGDKDNHGIIPRALSEIFTAINTIREDEEYDVQMSYLEIYNEQSNDLLNPISEDKKKISLRENCDRVFEWHNLRLCPVQSFSQAMELLNYGDKNRIVCDTPMNIFSSRSHTILTIYVTSHIKKSLEIRKAKLNLVDLAGSERVHKTGEQGIVLEEARHINLSLHYLQQVIIALSDSSRTHVPYRNCSLTAALRDSLGGNCMTAMVANIAINKANFEETVSTCRFAQRVALVRNEISVNLEKDLNEENRQLRQEILQLQKKCALLKSKVQATNPGDKKQEQTVEQDTTSTHEHEMNLNQLQTDMRWLQDEMRAKQSKTEGDETKLAEETSSSVVNTCNATSCEDVQDDFDKFAATMENKEDWIKGKQEEKEATEVLSDKVDVISCLHKDILNWWKQHEQTLVKDMLNGQTLHIMSSESVPDLVPKEPLPRFDHEIEKLLASHSSLLKDIQLLKSRLRCTKRNLQRIKRKYSMEYNIWKKSGKSSSESLSESIDLQDELIKVQHQGEYLDLTRNNRGTHRNTYKGNITFNDLNNLGRKNSEDKELESDTSFSFYDSDLNTTLGDVNDSAFSTSTQLTNNRVHEFKPLSDVRLTRSTPGLHPVTPRARCRNVFTITNNESDRPLSVPLVHLTGDPDIDDEIIAFYKNKRSKQ